MSSESDPSQEITIDEDELIELERDIAAAASAVEEIERYSSSDGDYEAKVAAIRDLVASPHLQR